MFTSRGKLPLLLASGCSLSFSIPPSLAASAACGPSTFYDKTSDACLCDADQHPQTKLNGASYDQRQLALKTNDSIRILGLFDTDNWYWGRELFNYTMAMVNDPNDGWMDDLLNGTNAEWDVKNSACDGPTASREYWASRTENGGVPPHGVTGCRCSSATTSSANVAGLEGVPQVSPASTASDLSDKSLYPYFARTVSSNSHEVKAVIAMLRSFSWTRVSIIQTDTAYSASWSTTFQQLWAGNHDDDSGVWEGDIAYTHTISIDQDDSVNAESAKKALDRVPTGDPINNSRIILLIAHSQHAFSILRTAAEENFQPDTVWVGVGAWSNRYPSDIQDFMSVFPADKEAHPGYLGLTPYMGKNEYYVDFLRTLQEAQNRDGFEPWLEFPDYAAGYMVDSIIALVKALMKTPQKDRRNGTHVMSHLLDSDFEGVSGRVRFTSEGDRKDPRYSLWNFKRTDGDGASWVSVGETGSEIGSAEIGMDLICWAEVGCGLEVAPSDSYPVPEPEPIKLPIWIPIVISVIAVLLLGVTYRYVRVERKKKELKRQKKELDWQMSEMQKKIEAIKNIDQDLDNIDQAVDDAQKRKQSLIMKRADILGTPSTWTESSDTLVPIHPDNEEYWHVLSKMQDTIPDCHISKLWRVQNKSLWSYYSFHKDRLENNDINPNERRVWHGTSSLDPNVVYNDKMDGFMMQFAAQGLWGRGIYFADKASYSMNYSHTPANSQTSERPAAKKDELEMFLTRLIVGKEVMLKQDRSLTVPPIDTSTGYKYNSVTGVTAGSQVWIVYENGRAYPEYLIRYYTGSRDKNRSPYGSKKEASKSKTWSSSMSFERELSTSLNIKPDASSPTARQGSWEYLADTGWVAYDSTNQTLIEKTYKDFAKDPTSKPSVVHIQGPEWSYAIDIATMKQKNIQHQDAKERKIRFNSTLP